MRSDFANETEDTFVEFTFSHMGRTYTIYRSPQYEKRKKTGTSVKSSNTGKKNNTEKNTTIAVENKTEPIKDKKKTFLLQ